jgi:hypothetical protein
MEIYMKQRRSKRTLIKKEKGKDIVVFTCNQCRTREVEDFIYYPLCKRCKESNIKMLKKEKKEKNEENP